ncbi:MAG: hypothetical protein KF821_09025 [Anaerolineales bacterium]|nr:hypothetical protein [Anaerolineales bacterium]
MNDYVRAIRPIPMPDGSVIYPGAHLQLPAEQLDELVAGGQAVRVQSAEPSVADPEPAPKTEKAESKKHKEAK